MDLRLYARVPTEQSNPASRGLDRLSPGALFDLMNRQDAVVVRAVARAKPAVLKAVALVTDRLAQGGRLFLAGAGTSGRLCVLEAAECPPTFNTAPGQIQAFMAGGRSGVFKSREGAEDQDGPLRRVLARTLRPADVVVAVAASGVTAYARGALAEARRRGAGTIFLTANPAARVPADVRVVFRTGPEILTGSTRLKAGTATKMILNMITTLSMVRLGKVHGHWMVDLQPRSKKLRARALRLVETLGGVPSARARRLFQQSGGRVKEAILMARRSWTVAQARAALAEGDGRLDRALRVAWPLAPAGRTFDPSQRRAGVLSDRRSRGG